MFVSLNKVLWVKSTNKFSLIMMMPLITLRMLWKLPMLKIVMIMMRRVHHLLPYHVNDDYKPLTTMMLMMWANNYISDMMIKWWWWPRARRVRSAALLSNVPNDRHLTKYEVEQYETYDNVYDDDDDDDNNDMIWYDDYNECWLVCWLS